MAGQRFAIPGARELSAVCTHPAHLSKGYANALLRAVTRHAAEHGTATFLNVTAGNDRAKSLYLHLGFADRAQTTLYFVSR